MVAFQIKKITCKYCGNYIKGYKNTNYDWSHKMLVVVRARKLLGFVVNSQRI